MPAEGDPHEGCLIAWPTREDLWGSVLDRARREYADVATAVARFEPVTIVAHPGAADEVRAMVEADVTVVEVPIDDSWVRDSGPIFVVDEAGGRAAVDFRFNSWGERFLPYDKDAAMTELLLSRLGVERLPSDLVLEGGAITVDGRGTLITTEQCLLNPNRNPGRGREEIEAELGARLGVSKVIWLPYGHLEDEHTDGHVDGVCAFARPGVVVIQSCEDPAHPDFERMRSNRAVLEGAVDARGGGFELVELPYYPRVEVGGQMTTVSYLNFYLANGGVVVPIAGHDLDDEALDRIAAAFPERQVVGVPAATISYGGGGVHCITQQVPAAGG